MVEYKVVHHVPGRIRLHAPIIKQLPVATLKRLANLPIPEGINIVRANPVTGSIIIAYDPALVDILEYLKEMMTNRELLIIIGMRTC